MCGLRRKGLTKKLPLACAIVSVAAAAVVVVAAAAAAAVAVGCFIISFPASSLKAFCVSKSAVLQGGGGQQHIKTFLSASCTRVFFALNQYGLVE